MKIVPGLCRIIWRQGRRSISTSSFPCYYSYEPAFPIAGRQPKIASAQEAVSVIKSSRYFVILLLHKKFAI